MDRGIALLVQRQEEELEARRKALAESREAAEAIAATSARQRQDLPAGVELLADLDQIQARMESLLQANRQEVCSIVPTVMSADALAAARPLDTEALSRGITQRLLWHEGVRNNPTALAYARWMAQNGAQIRTAPLLPHRLLLIDRTSALIPADPADPGAGAALITNPGITAAETDLLRLLAAGLTDEAAAKRLNVSVRTVKRRMEDLMHRLGANSRFQAGANAAGNGWL